MIAVLRRRFDDLPIKAKVSWVIYSVSMVGLLTAALALYASQMRVVRTTFREGLDALGAVVAESCARPMAANDGRMARQTLAFLAAKPEITSAAVLTKQGDVLAQYGAGFSVSTRATARDGWATEEDGRWNLVRPVVLDGSRIGSLIINVDYPQLRTQMTAIYGGIGACVIGFSFLLVVALTARLQPLITAPIAQLAATARAVTKNKDYSVRATKLSKDELGELADSFNQMLADIQRQDAALQGAHAEVKKQVRALHLEIAERQRAEIAQERLTAILEATPDFVGKTDINGNVLYLNRAARRMLGVADEEPVEGFTMWQFQPGWARKIVSTEGTPEAIHHGTWAGETALLTHQGLEIHVSQVMIAHKRPNGGVEFLSTVMRDITERKQAEEALRISQQKLLETSRFAGMAEVATGVLHNVGNVLNSVNVSTGLVVEKLRLSKVPKLAKAAALLTGRNGDLARYLTEDPNGQKLPGYLAKLGAYLEEENAAIVKEVDQLGRNVEHIKEIVAMQQSYAKISGAYENLPPEALVEDAIAMNLGAFERHGVTLIRDFHPTPLVRVDRHKVLQILINLIRNAKYALDDAKRREKRITIRIVPWEENAVRVIVEDNGIGISAENLTRIFAHGFTTRKNGHGFGLHSGANAAREIGGSLTAESKGLELGATFTLQIPVASAAQHP